MQYHAENSGMMFRIGKGAELFDLSTDVKSAIHQVLDRNSAVGVMCGTYEEFLPIWSVSDYLLAIIGYQTAEDFLASTNGHLFSLVFPEDRAILLPSYFMAMEKGGTIRFIGQNGTPIWVHLEKTEASIGEIRLWIMSVRNIDILKRTRGNINNSSQDFLKIYNKVLKLNLTNDTYKIIRDADEKTVATSSALSHWLKEFAISGNVHEAEREDYFNSINLDSLRRHLKNGEKYISYRYRRLVNGQFRWGKLEVVRAPDYSDHRQIAILYITDIEDDIRTKGGHLDDDTKFNSARDALVDAYAAADRASRIKNDFLSNMSHDIRTPMNAIIGMTAIANAHIDNPERVSDCLVKITLASKQLLGLINELLDMSKIESGRFDLLAEKFNIEAVVDDVISFTRPEIKAKNLTYSVNTAGLTNKSVIGDAHRLKQALLNFWTNAINFTSSGGHISLTATEKDTHRPKVGCYEFVISDTGIGIPPDFIPFLFEPFTAAAPPREDGIHRTGLGLPIANNIIKLMNGTIAVDSTLGKGSTFTVTIFLELSDVMVNETTENTLDTLASEDFSGRRALIVEDNELNAEIAAEILGMTGIEVEYAKDGREAFDMVSASPDGYYDVIFMDIQMPVMNGYDATLAIRSLPRQYAKKVPILAMTANAFAEDVRAAIAAGMNEHIAKPIDFATLALALKRHLT